MSDNLDMERIFKLSLDLICMVGTDGYLKKVNSAFTRLLGYTEKELLETPYLEFIVPEDRDPTLNGVSQVLQGGSLEYFENRLLCKDGSEKRLAWNGVTSSDPRFFYVIGRDITEQHKMREELRQTVSLYKTLVENADDAIILMDPHFKHIYQNPKYAQSLGLTPEEAKQFNPYDNIHPEDRQRVVEGRPGLLEKGTLQSEYRIRHKDGRWVHRMANSVVVRDDAGKPKYVLSVIRDMDELYSALQSLQDSEEMFHQLSDASFEGVNVLEKGTILFANKAFGQIFGYSNAELVGMTPFNLTAPECHATISANLATNSEEPFEVIGLRKDGTRFPLGVQGRRTFHKGIERRVSVVRDLTERKTAEREKSLMITIIDQTSDSIAITGIDNTVQYVNPAFEKTLGYSREEIVGKDFRILSSGKQDPGIRREVSMAISSGSSWTGLVINRRKDGTLIEQDAVISPIREANGEITSFSAIFRDVTTEKMLDRAKEYFTQVASHELRTPLNNFKLFRLMIDQQMARQPGDDLRIMRKVAHNVFSGLERIVTATEIYSDLSLNKKFPIYPFNLRKAVLSVVEGARAGMQSEERQIRITEEYDGELNRAPVTGVEWLVRRAVEEVLSNAVKYTPDGGNITVRAHLKSGKAVVEVKDEGIGMEREPIEKMFDPYFSAENISQHSTGSFKFKGGGIGLGLTLAKMIVDHHHGEITIVPCDEGGVCVSIRLPLGAGNP